MTRPTYQGIERWKKKYKLTSTPVTIVGGYKLARIILDTNYSEYYNTYVWGRVRATKKDYFLVEYEDPHTYALIREWIHENYIDPKLLDYKDPSF